MRFTSNLPPRYIPSPSRDFTTNMAINTRQVFRYLVKRPENTCIHDCDITDKFKKGIRGGGGGAHFRKIIEYMYIGTLLIQIRKIF